MKAFRIEFTVPANKLVTVIEVISKETTDLHIHQVDLDKFSATQTVSYRNGMPKRMMLDGRKTDITRIPRNLTYPGGANQLFLDKTQVGITYHKDDLRAILRENGYAESSVSPTVSSLVSLGRFKYGNRNETIRIA